MRSTDIRYALIFGFVFLVAVICTMLFGSDALAAAGTSPGRKVWDNVLLFVNFGILVVLFLKYGKKPLMEFLRGERQKIEDNLDTVNDQFEGVRSEMDAEAKRLEDIEQRLKEIKAGILEIAEKEKEKIIEMGRLSAEKMIKDAEQYAAYQIATARKALSEEMVDIAMSMVEERITKEISEEDNEKMIEQFVSDLEAGKPKL